MMQIRRPVRGISQLASFPQADEISISGALPQPTLPFANNTTASYMSLNTTTSDPSQFPPSGDGAHTSISNLPRWHIPLAKLSFLQSLITTRPKRGRARTKMPDDPSSFINVIVCVTSVEAPVIRQRKEERAAGREGTLWISKWCVVVPPEAGVDANESDEVGCDVKLWEECAREWGSGKVRRGDVVLLQGQSYSQGIECRESRLMTAKPRCRTTLTETSRRTIQACYSTRKGPPRPLINHISLSHCHRIIPDTATIHRDDSRLSSASDFTWPTYRQESEWK